MLRRIIDSHWAFRLLLAVPALVMLWQFFFGAKNWGLLLGQSGEWAVRMLLLTLAVTPVRLLMRQAGLGPHWPMWLFQRRRDLGLAAFLFDMQFREYIAGWAAFITMLALALTSNDRAVHGLGRWWKPLQRLAYVSAAAAAFHWMWIRRDDTAMWLHFIPLAALEAYRLWYNFARPSGVRQ